MNSWHYSNASILNDKGNNFCKIHHPVDQAFIAMHDILTIGKTYKLKYDKFYNKLPIVDSENAFKFIDN